MSHDGAQPPYTLSQEDEGAAGPVRGSQREGAKARPGGGRVVAGEGPNSTLTHLRLWERRGPVPLVRGEGAGWG